MSIFSVYKINQQMLLFSPSYDTYLKDTIFLINQLAKKGQKVSKDKHNSDSRKLSTQDIWWFRDHM